MPYRTYSGPFRTELDHIRKHKNKNKNVTDAHATTSTAARHVRAFQINTKITIRLCLVTFFLLFFLNFLFSRTENLFGNSKQTKDKNRFQISIYEGNWKQLFSYFQFLGFKHQRTQYMTKTRISFSFFLFFFTPN